MSLKRLAAVLGGLLVCLAISAAPASAGVQIVTGDDEHCSGNAGSPFCDFTYKIVEYARGDAPDQSKGLLLIDCDNDPAWIEDAYAINGELPELTSVCPGQPSYSDAEFTTDSYSAIAIATSQATGGVLNARAGDFEAFYNDGGGIVTFNAASGGASSDYDFLPLGPIVIGGDSVTDPYFMTDEGKAELAVTDEELNDNYSQHEFYDDPAPGSGLTVGARDNVGEAIVLFGGVPDGDQDGFSLRDDNCPPISNANQSDIDKDGVGDPCDDDADGDGLTRDQEKNLGTDDLKADTDGDGTADGLDRCGTRAGNENGCPPAATAASPQAQPLPLPQLVFPRLLPNRVTARVAKRRSSRGVRLTTTGQILLPAGLTPALGCSGGGVVVSVKSGTRTISTRVVDLQPNCTFTSAVNLGSRSRLGRRKLGVTALFTGNSRLLRRQSSKVDAGRP